MWCHGKCYWKGLEKADTADCLWLSTTAISHTSYLIILDTHASPIGTADAQEGEVNPLRHTQAMDPLVAG